MSEEVISITLSQLEAIVKDTVRFEEDRRDILAAARKASSDHVDLLRKLLWTRHGCSVSSLYGDDGEMQCLTCRIDFKRMSAVEITRKFIKIGKSFLAADLIDRTFTIIEGNDNFSNENYIKAIVKDEANAKEYIAEIEPNGSLPDSFRSITCTMKDLETDVVKSAFTGRPFDFVQKARIVELASKI